MKKRKTTPEPLSHTEKWLIDQVVERYCRAAKKVGMPVSPGDVVRLNHALAACHMGPCPLKLDQMLKWKRDFDIIHDVVGIANRYDTTVGGKLDLSDCFLPRFAQPTPRARVT